mmetsp:Transcript_40953/g.47054  ORF Transcript_40953/g.47054 Transcript_40953/m.47054 type:complete len:174 (+) Transcript_40953:38-559(+)
MSSSVKKPSYDHILKLIIIGDTCVGKSSLLLRFSEDYFPTTHMPTIGIDFKIKTITVKKKVVKLQVWDTAGQERFRNITQTYYKGAAAILLVYDCTDRRTFENISSWMKQIDTHASKDVVKVLIANKTDSSDREVLSSEGNALAEEYGIEFFETSAKTGKNVNEAFVSVTSTL